MAATAITRPRYPIIYVRGYGGTFAVAGTIATLDKTMTAASEASTVPFSTGSDRMALIRLGLQ